MLSPEAQFLFVASSGLLFVFFLLLLIALRRLSGNDRSLKTVDATDKLFTKNDEFELLNSVNEVFSNSLSMGAALEEVIVHLQGKVPFSAVSYVLIHDNRLIFKALLYMGVSPVFVSDIKSKMLAKCAELSNNATATKAVEEFVTGGPLNSASTAKVGASFIIPIQADNQLLGVLGFFSSKANIYNDVIISLVTQVLASVLASLVRLQKVVDREKEKLQAMVDSMSDGVVLVDKNFTILVINPSVYKLLDLAEKESMNILDIAGHFSDVLTLEDTISKVFATGTSSTFSGVQVAEKFYEVVVVPVKGNNEILGAGILIHDQTKEEELKRLRREFSAMVIHELRSPLSVIRGTSDLLLSHADTLSHDQVTSFLNQIHDSTINLLGMVNDLLDAAKVESGKVELFRESTDLNKLLVDACSYYNNLALQHSITLSCEVSPAVGVLSLDAKKLHQVVNNLLSNALKFTEHGGVITLYAEDHPDAVHICVADTGKGIPDDLKDKVFEKYVQGRDSGEKGTGLGLVIVKGIIEAHGGRIWIEDNSPKGTKFIFTLPKE